MKVKILFWSFDIYQKEHQLKDALSQVSTNLKIYNISIILIMKGFAKIVKREE